MSIQAIAQNIEGISDFFCHYLIRLIMDQDMDINQDWRLSIRFPEHFRQMKAQAQERNDRKSDFVQLSLLPRIIRAKEPEIGRRTREYNLKNATQHINLYIIPPTRLVLMHRARRNIASRIFACFQFLIGAYPKEKKELRRLASRVKARAECARDARLSGAPLEALISRLVTRFCRLHA